MTNINLFGNLLLYLIRGGVKIIKIISTIIILEISCIISIIPLILFIALSFKIISKKFDEKDDLITNYVSKNLEKIIVCIFLVYSFSFLSFSLFAKSILDNLNLSYSLASFYIVLIINFIIPIYKYLKHKEYIINKYRKKLIKR